MSMVDQEEEVDEDEENLFKKISETYLRNKFEACDRPEGCRFSCDKNDATALLKEILPPVTQDELDREVDVVLGSIPSGNDITEIDFIRAVLSNTYWKEAGKLVVKELIFLDALYSNYQKKVQLLNDDVYDELKDSLTWEGSAVAVLRGDEARFIYAVAAYQRGESLMTDDEYEKLKASLVKEKSWVVNRTQDPLEKMGMNTFMGYLHRQLNKA